MPGTPANLKQSSMCRIMLFLSCAFGGFKSSFPHAPPVHEASCLALAFYHLPALKWEADNTRASRFWAKTTAIFFFFCSGELSSEKNLLKPWS